MLSVMPFFLSYLFRIYTCALLVERLHSSVFVTPLSVFTYTHSVGILPLPPADRAYSQILTMTSLFLLLRHAGDMSHFLRLDELEWI